MPMKRRPAVAYLPAILLALGVLMAVEGAHAQSAAELVAPAAAIPASTPAADVPEVRVSAASARLRDPEAVRMRRAERRHEIAETLGIPVEQVNDLLDKIRPDAEERRRPSEGLAEAPAATR